MADAIDLTPFCGELERYNFDKPFNQDGYRIGTDGRVCVRIRDEATADTPDINVPKVRTLAWPVVGERVMHPWPSATYHWDNQVLGAISSEDGESDIWGWMPEPGTMDVAHHLINSEYHYVISRLPNVKYLPAPNPMGMIYFTFDGGDGLLMPMRRDNP